MDISVEWYIDYTSNPYFYLSSTYGCHALKYFNITDFVLNVNLIKKRKLLIITFSLYRNTAKDIYITLSKNIIISLSRLHSQKTAIIIAEAVWTVKWMSYIVYTFALCCFWWENSSGNSVSKRAPWTHLNWSLIGHCIHKLNRIVCDWL